jgi:exodeoxyribonuclease VII large subunit
MPDHIPESLTVTELTCYLKGIVENAVTGVWVDGEISNLSRPRSGHVYFTLKDDQSQIRGVMWRSTAAKLRFEPKEGQHVLAYGGVEIYGPQGVYQLIVRKLEPQGIGALQLAFQQLQERLQAEGLFDPARKKPLPPFPRRIGVVTSPTGAAIRDFLEIALRRWPTLDVTIIPAKVQGAGAAQSIAGGIKAANRIKPSLDLVVVTRGGGSMEDLWCFNEEPVVRAIAASRLPTVSAVGHEIDVTLADFAADFRALTPSEAAERIIPELRTLTLAIDHAANRLQRPILERIRYHKEQLRQLRQRPVIRRPFEMVQTRFQDLDELDSRMKKSAWELWKRRRSDVESVTNQLANLSPLQTLSRGFTYTKLERTGEALRSIEQAQAGEVIRTQTTDGSVLSVVQTTEPAATVHRP